MLGDFIYSADVSEVSTGTPSSVEAATSYKDAVPWRFEKAARRFLLFTALFVIGGLVWIFCISPCMVPAKIEIRSFSGISNAEVLNIAGINSGDTYISINAREVEQQLSRYYLIESAKAVKRFPDRLSIFLEPRQAVAMTLARINGRTQMVYFDRHGVVFRVGSGAGSAPAWIPVVSGILDDTQPVKLGMTLAPSYLPLLSRIGTISDEDPKIWQAVSELKIAGKSNNLFDLVLYPVNDSIRLRMKNEISKESIHYALLMLDAYRQFGVDVSNEIDVRSGIGVVNMKEASFVK